MESSRPLGPATPVLRRFWKTPFQFALLVTAVLSAKLLHLYNHITSLPPLLFLLYLPTFLALDVVIAVIFWLMVHMTAHGRIWILLSLARGIVCLVILGASSVQIAFYLETGGEIKWGAAGNFASDPAAMRLLLSGGVEAFFVSIVIAAVAFVISQPLYSGMEAVLSRLVETVTGRRYPLRQLPKELSNEYLDSEASSYASSISSEEDGLEPRLSTDNRKSFEDAPLLVESSEVRRYPRWVRAILFLAPFTTVVILLIVRPRNFPYAHMSGSLPFTLGEIWTPYSEDLCQAGSSREFALFPLPELVSSEFWENPEGKYPGWMPTANMSDVMDSERHRPARPDWLPEEKMHGFGRWYHHKSHHGHFELEEEHSIEVRRGRKGNGFYKGVNYDPVKDPLRITNLDQDLLGPITEALKDRKVPIKHVVIISLESTRKDVFPLKEGSHMHDMITKSHGSDEDSISRVNQELSSLTVNAELLTGEDSGFQTTFIDYAANKSATWRNLAKDRGGINVMGAFTGSTCTFKSMIGSHCGVQPLPVDFTVEAHGHIYQACLPDIFKLFNHNKTPRQLESRGSKSEEMSTVNSMPWKSAFVQSITDQYDHQDELNNHMGFSEVIVKSTLLDPTSKHYPPTEKESNYFGFPETQVKPYLRDLFTEAKEKNERLFLSHFTSSTHHPWNVPEGNGEEFEFLKKGRWRSEHQLNRYLNTVKYEDRWVGEFMDMLEGLGVAEETLVVMVGDHGMAFEEDSPKYSTFENGHISNIRVPLVFHHPSLPRIQLGVNATSMSIIPTILDLLVTTSSLNTQDSDIASNLIHQYEGQSLIRPYQVSKKGRQSWIVTVLNAGGAVLSVSSAAVPYRLTLPICKAGEYRFTDSAQDPNELHPVEEYDIEKLASKLAKGYGEEAAQWVIDAEKIGKWWVLEQRRRWRFAGASLQGDRKPEELRGAGAVKKEHWWDT